MKISQVFPLFFMAHAAHAATSYYKCVDVDLDLELGTKDNKAEAALKTIAIDADNLIQANVGVACQYTSDATGTARVLARLKSDALTEGVLDKDKAVNRGSVTLTPANKANNNFVITNGGVDAYLEFTVSTAEATKTITDIQCLCYINDAPTTTKTEKKPAECFSAHSTVEVVNKGKISVAELAPGDLVLSSNNKYDRVLGFTHKNRDATAEFLQIFVENQSSPLEVTGKHMLYKHGYSHPVSADSLQKGDILAGIEPREIVKIDKVTRMGLFSPLTQSGNIFVEGIKSSNYISLQSGDEYASFRNGMSTGISQHTGIHIFVTPFRILCLSGFSSTCNTHDQDGYLTWVKKGIELAQAADEQNVLVQLVMLFCALALFLPFYCLEVAGFVPAVVAGLFYLAARNIISVRKVKTA